MFVRNLAPKEKEYTRREKGGFGIRVLPSGRKVFFYMYRVDGQRRFLNLGTFRDRSYPDGITLVKAREEYEAERAKVKALKAGRVEGADPVAVKRQKRSEREVERKAPSVAELAEEYLTRHAKKFKRSWQEDERILKRDVLPAWGKRKASDISRRDIHLLLEKIVDRGAPVMANNTFKIIRKMFNYAVQKDILPQSPAQAITLPSPKVIRERVLSEGEVRTLWLSLDTAAMTDDVCRALKLILVTAQRPSEVIGLHTSEIEGRWWTIPSSRAKNGKPHNVYLTDTALQLMGDLQIIDPATGKARPKGFIFPSRRYGEMKPITRHALSKAVLTNCPSECGNDCSACTQTECKGDSRPLEGKNRLRIPHFVPHDLRRTAATFMAKGGELDEVIDAVLNHVKQGVIRHYNLHRYDREKQAALENWERKLLSIIHAQQPGAVISLNSRRRR